jgi:hypothetical protein
VPFQQTGNAEQVLACSVCMIGSDWQRIAANAAFANYLFVFGHIDLRVVVIDVIVMIVVY